LPSRNMTPITFINYPALLLSIAFLTPTSALSQENSQIRDIDVKIKATLIKVINGKETMEPAVDVKPGDTIEYQAIYVNKSGHRINQIQAILPIPNGTEYVPKTAHPAYAEARVENGEFKSIPLKTEVRGGDGLTHTITVPEKNYRELRWRIDHIDPSKNNVVSMRVKVQKSEQTNKDRA